MNCLFLTLKGSMRSWGTTSVGDDRWTAQWPTASAILGLTGACIGVDRHNPEQISAWYNGFLVCTLSATTYKARYHFRQNRECHPALFSDFQTIRNSLNMNGKHRKDTIVSHRGYIADGLDIAAIIPVHNDAEQWLEQLIFAVQQPHFTPYLGRRSNPLSEPLTDPGEGIVKVNSSEEMGEQLVARLFRKPIGYLLPTRCMLRLPTELLERSGNFSKKWHFSGEDIIADHRAGFLRTFKNRKIYNFYCDCEQGEFV